MVYKMSCYQQSCINSTLLSNMRGDKKRRTQGFQKGNIPWNQGLTFDSDEGSDLQQQTQPKPVIRMSAEQFELVARSRSDDSLLPTPDCEGISSSVRLLRPLPADRSKSQDGSSQVSEGMRLVDSEEMAKCWNESIRLHHSTSPDCANPNLVIHRERKWGVCWKVVLKCTACDFETPEMKLYKEVKQDKPGPNPAAANLALAVGLEDTPISTTRARLLMATMDMVPPAKSSMQRTANQVGKAVTELNTKDMADKVQLIKQVNRDRGVELNEVNIAMDGRYNSTTITSRKKPGQNASQAIGLACETVTDKKYIIGASFQNKLCWTGAWLRGKGLEVTCPGGHAECTSTMSTFAPFSEKNMGKDIGDQLALQGMLIKYVTTDGDSRSAEGVDSAMKTVDPMWRVERLADPTHLAQGQFRHCYKANFSPEMFTGTTREQRKQQQRVLSQDVKARCSLILKELMKTHAGDMNALRSILPRVLEATLLCYSGDCSRCARHSVVCSGGVSRSWWTRSMHLCKNKISNFNMNDSDKHLLQEILKMKLSVEVVEQMKFYTDTQKCEAANRSLSVSLPKNVNFSRNYMGRASSTIHRLNNGPGTSAIEKTECVGVHLSAGAVRALHEMDDESKYQKNYNKDSAVVKRKLLQQGEHIGRYIKAKASMKDKSDYRKGQLDPKPSTSQDRDHSYSK